VADSSCLQRVHRLEYGFFHFSSAMNLRHCSSLSIISSSLILDISLKSKGIIWKGHFFNVNDYFFDKIIKKVILKRFNLKNSFNFAA